MQSVRLKRAGAARHLLEARDFSRVRLHGEKKDAKTLDLAQYEISIDDENRIVKLTRKNRENTDEIRPVYVMPFFH